MYDTAYKMNVAKNYIRITVNRNANVPRFLQNSYDKTVSANFPLVTEAIKVEATDPDGVSNCSRSNSIIQGQTTSIIQGQTKSIIQGQTTPIIQGQTT